MLALDESLVDSRSCNVFAAQAAQVKRQHHTQQPTTGRHQPRHRRNASSIVRRRRGHLQRQLAIGEHEGELYGKPCTPAVTGAMRPFAPVVRSHRSTGIFDCELEPTLP